MREPLNTAVIIMYICTACICLSCQKVFEGERSVESANNPQDPDPVPVSSKSILVDASRDGGVWWFPQGNTFDASTWHQGTGLVEYLKSLGYSVDELPRGATVTKELLRKYRRIVRAVCWGTYTMEEIAAYQEFLKGENSLLLFTDHSANPATDQLATLLGLKLEGSYFGPLTRFNQHAVTANVTSLHYIAGSVIKNPDLDNITVLAYYDDANIRNAAAMGILKHPSCKIVFIGDINGLEQLPQPLTYNLAKWLF